MSITVVNAAEDSRVPFLRGMLTRALIAAGLDFDEAYDIADTIRSGISERDEIETNELKELVEEELKSRGHIEQRAVSNSGPSDQQYRINIVDRDGQPIPFSKGHLAQTLEICSFDSDKSYEITRAIEHQLLDSGRIELTSTELAHFTYDHLLENEGRESARRYLSWIEFSRSGGQLVLMIGGTTGCGKSTVSSELAHRLNIVRTQSTDMLREVMRLMIPDRLAPTLHCSSFNAWQAIPTRPGEPATVESHLEVGYQAQARQVAVGIRAVMSRARREQVSMIVEGVHIYPELQRETLEELTKPIIVPIILAVLKRKRLRKQLKGRGQQVASRRSERYLENFDAIWNLQTYLLGQAEEKGIPIVANTDDEETIQSIMDQIAEVLVKRYKSKPVDVFSELGAQA